MASNVSGRAAAIPEAEGVRVELELTEEDVYGAAAIRFGPFDLSRYCNRSAGASPITRDEWLFRSPPPAAAGAFPPKSLNALEEMFGDIPVKVSAWIDGISGESRSAVIEEFEVVGDR